MGFGNPTTRKTFQKEVAGKSNWRDSIDSPNAAYTMIQQIKTNLAKDPNGPYLLAAYCHDKIKELEDYIANGKGKTLKEYHRGKT